MFKEAYLYTKLAENKVRCDLCAHRCVIKDGEKGKCAVRQNKGGILSTLVYDKVISENVDPIEKKPLFHFMPGTLSLSIATPGCNFKCFFCQNWQISQMPDDHGIIDGEEIAPEKIVNDAIRSNCKSISYTYTEPTIFFELAYDTAKIAHKRGLKNIFVTNGFMTKECLDMIQPYLDAANVDLKGFSEDFYREKIGGRLKPVLESIKNIHDMGIWLEVTTLLIPGLNDSGEELESIAKFIMNLSQGIPWHVSAYYPQYKSEIPPTSLRSIRRAIEIGMKTGLKYVYGGNIRAGGYEDTICPGCGETIIKRNGFSVETNRIINGKCSYCHNKIDGIF
ncbi:MAG: AmmeMemoRadiSam system radical SAM enzyme [Actinobacteria bacterium]|nr:AmmeMemoRadiSam system radical SAM enzyme [Actinomycetota bacterium]